MKDRSVARRYAQALFELAQERDLLERLRGELDQVNSILDTESRARGVLEHRIIPKEDKKRLLRGVFSEQIADLTLNFLLLLVDKGRERHLKAITQEFSAIYDQVFGLIDAEVVSATELDSELEGALRESLGRATGKHVRLQSRVDQSLLGGLVVTIGDKRIDGSVRRRLEEMRRLMSGADQRQEGVKLA